MAGAQGSSQGNGQRGLGERKEDWTDQAFVLSVHTPLPLGQHKCHPVPELWCVQASLLSFTEDNSP